MNKSDLIKTLSPISYYVTQENGTERPHTSPYNDFSVPGIYVDIVSGEPLFSTLHQYNAGCGWPSFTQPIDKIVEKKDKSHGMIRIEVRSEKADSHLGHVFHDGPTDKGGLRYCINGAALRFIALEDLEKEGYKDFKVLFEER